MRILTTLLFLIIFFHTDLIAQTKKTKNPPGFTPASERWEGYLQRKRITENSLVKNVPFRNAGPTIMSGRVVDIEVNPRDPTHFYVAYASGGLWETKNEGTSFTPLFDEEIVMTIGDIAVDWNNSILYIGSGENNASRSSYSGYGFFKSDDNGEEWTHLGLEETHHIGRVILHPEDPNTIWVAALGHLYSENKERGIYKTTDWGKSWEKTLYINESTGLVELVINPSDPNELLAAAWDKDRKAWDLRESGKGSALFKSTDGGVTWLNVSSGDNGFPDTEGVGRIGLAYAASSPNMVYAILDNQDRRPKEDEEAYAVSRELLLNTSMDAFQALANNDINDFLDREGFPADFNAIDLKRDIKSGTAKPEDLVTYLQDANSMLFDTPVKGAEVYVSENGGETWRKTHEGYIDALVFSYGYYFGQIRVDARDPNAVYVLGVPLIKSMDGGRTWEFTSMENAHADHHALWLNPDRAGHLINGNDGGINISYDFGETWVKCNSAPVGQFYTVAVDMAEPYNIYGGLQDNGVWKGPSDYEFSYSWYEEGKYPYERLLGGDGMQVAIDTRNNHLVYTGYQFGNYYRINTKTGERSYITPKHKLGEAPFRWNWQAPIMLSPHNQDIVYFGSNKFHRSMDQGAHFETLSGDLTNGGKKGDVSYGTLTTLTESPLRFGLIYAGSDDGLIHVSRDAGQSWICISDDLPKQYWISRLTVSAHKEGRIYASLNGYRWDDFSALVYGSEDYGESWKQLGINLPQEPVNVIKEDPENENVLYVGTDHGVYVSLDRGENFMAFDNGLPAVAVHDLVIHPREKELVLGTHGRSIFIADISAIQEIAGNQPDLKLFTLDEFTHSSRWGDKGSWHWTGYNEPRVTLEVFSKSGGTATMQVLRDDLILKIWNTVLEPGLNYIDYDLTLEPEKARELNMLLELDGDTAIQEKENDTFYLVPGEFTMQVLKEGHAFSTTLKITAPRSKKKRKGSE